MPLLPQGSTHPLAKSLLAYANSLAGVYYMSNDIVPRAKAVLQRAEKLAPLAVSDDDVMQKLQVGI